MKFLADMGISPKTVAFLRNCGYSAIHLHEQGLDRLPDPEIMKKALLEGYIILTHDLDFGELVAASGARLPSVIIFRLRNMRPDNVNQHLYSILTPHQDALEQGAIVSVTERRARVRLLPLD
jgi:predicted nuclease of predicted toxin-antitoxin system